MDSKNEFEPALPVSELLALATAIAAREQKELSFSRTVIGAVQDEPMDTTVESEAYIDGAIRNLLRIQYPDVGGYTRSMLDTQLQSRYQRVVEDIYERTGKRVSIEVAKEAVLNYAMDLMDTAGQTEEQSSQDFKDLLGGAQYVANLHGVQTPDVYDSDELFEEAHRATYTIGDFAERYVAMLSRYTVQTMTQTSLRSIGQATVLAPVDPAIIILDQGFRDNVIQQVIKQREGIQLIARTQLVRIWGEEAVLALPDAIRRKLGI